MQFQSSKYTAPWPPQRLDMFIDHEGIKYFRFCNPIEVTGIEKAKLLPLDEIKKIIIDYFKAGYERVNLVEEDVPTITRITTITFPYKNNRPIKRRSDSHLDCLFYNAIHRRELFASSGTKHKCGRWYKNRPSL